MNSPLENVTQATRRAVRTSPEYPKRLVPGADFGFIVGGKSQNAGSLMTQGQPLAGGDAQQPELPDSCGLFFQ